MLIRFRRFSRYRNREARESSGLADVATVKTQICASDREGGLCAAKAILVSLANLATRDLKEEYRNYVQPGSWLASAILHELIAREPQNASLWRHLSDVHYRNGRYKMAARCLRHRCVVVDRKPHDYRRYIFCLFQTGKRPSCLNHAICYTKHFGHSHIVSQVVFAIAMHQLARSHQLSVRAKSAVRYCVRDEWRSHHHLLDLVKKHLDKARPADPEAALNLFSYLKSCVQWPLIKAIVYRSFQRFDVARSLLGQMIRERKLLHPAVLRLAVEVCHIHGEIGADADIFRIAIERLSSDDPYRERAELVIETIAYYSKRTKSGVDLAVPQICFTAMPRYRNSDVGRDGNRIALFGGSLAAGGAEKILALLFKSIVESERTDVCDLYIYDLYSSPERRHFLDIIEKYGSRVYQLPRKVPRVAPLCYLPGALGNWSQSVAHVLRQGGYSTAYFSLDHMVVSGGLAALHCHVPNIILHTHNMAPTAVGYRDSELHGWRTAYRSLLSHSQTTLVTCCNAAARDYAQWADLPLESIRVIPNGLEFPARLDRSHEQAARHTFKIPRTSMVVGSAFRFDDVKQPMHWIEVAKRILAQQSGVHFVIFGDGPLKPVFETEIRKSGLQSRFSLPGRIANAPPHFSLFDAFLLTSKSEALPNVVVEAQAYRVPVFSFDVGGVAEAIVDGQSGQVTPPQRIETLADTLIAKMADMNWVRNAGAIAAHHSRSNFRTDLMAERFKQLLCA